MSGHQVEAGGTVANLDAFERLAAAFSRKQTRPVVAVVGPEASRPLYPTYDSIIDAFVDYVSEYPIAPPKVATRIANLARHDLDEAIECMRREVDSHRYRVFLKDIYSELHRDGRASYTDDQLALMRVPFSAYISITSDPGLLKAREELYLHRDPQVWYTWSENDRLRAWLDPAFLLAKAPAILFAHGHAANAADIRHGFKQFRQCFQHRPFTDVVRNLWDQAALVFVGFRFDDPYIRFLYEVALPQCGIQPMHENRHYVLAPEPLDRGHGVVLREKYLALLDADAVFYNDTSGSLKEERTGPVRGLFGTLKAFTPVPDAVFGSNLLYQLAAVEEPVQKRVHGTTEDEHYVPRRAELHELDRWTSNPAFNAIGVVAIGGLGKTSLIGYWMNQRQGHLRRGFKGVFTWSLYENRSIAEMLDALFELFLQIGVIRRLPDKRTGSGAASVLRKVPVFLLLDGMEVLQAAPGEFIGREDDRRKAVYGNFLDPDLSGLLAGLCSPSSSNAGTKPESLVVMTSRFPLTDLESYAGITYRELTLPGISDRDGAKLLERLGVRSEQERREEVSRRLNGHPLALRVFAFAAQDEGDDHDRLFQHVFVPVEGRNKFEDKLGRLFQFYDARLPPLRKALLTVLGVFRTSTSVADLLAVGSRLRAVAHLLVGVSEEDAQQLLAEMTREGLLFWEKDEISCHPILRDHYRQKLFANDPSAAQDLATALTDRPGSERITSLDQAEPILNAVSALVEAGSIKAAHDLYTARLVPTNSDARYWRSLAGAGNDNVFLNIPAIRSGLNASQDFVMDRDTRQQCVRQVGNTGLAFYLGQVFMYSLRLSEFEQAQKHCDFAIEMARKDVDDHVLADSYIGRAQIALLQGDLKGAVRDLEAPLIRVCGSMTPAQLCTAMLMLMDICVLRGKIDLAKNWRAEVERTVKHSGCEYDERLVVRSRYLPLAVACEHAGIPAEVTIEELLLESEVDLRRCRESHWTDEEIRCLLRRADAWAHLGEWQSATQDANAALELADSSQMDFELGWSLLAGFDYGRRASASFEGDPFLDRVFHVSMKGYRLLHAAALTVKAECYMERNSPAVAFDAAEAALRIHETIRLWWGADRAAAVAGAAAKALENERHIAIVQRWERSFRQWLSTSDRWALSRADRWRPGGNSNQLKNMLPV